MSAHFAPAFVMRFFQDGSGYAYDARIDQSTLTAVVEQWGAQFSRPAGHRFQGQLRDGRMVIGIVEAERENLDVRGDKRSACVVRGCILQYGYAQEWIDDFLIQLGKLPLPTKPGSHSSGLQIALPVRPDFPRLEHGGVNPASKVLLVAFLVLFGLQESAIFFVPELQSLVVSLIVRLSGLAFFYLLYRSLHSPMMSQSSFEEMEMRLFDHPSGWRAILDPSTHVFLSGQKLPHGNFRVSYEGNRPFPLRIDSPTYLEAVTHQGFAILRGVETLHFPDGSQTKCNFIRIYARRSREWYLSDLYWL